MYSTYLTIYAGNKMPMFYIGYSTDIKLANGYHGSVGSKEYAPTWQAELKNNPGLFKTKKLKTFESKTAALAHEQWLHNTFSVDTNPMYINKRRGCAQFHCSGHNAATRAKISDSLRRRLSDPSFDTKKMGDHSRGVKRGPQSAATIAKLSKIRKGKRMSDEQKEKLSAALKGRCMRPRASICKNWIITNIKTGAVQVISDRMLFCKELNLNYASFNVGTRNGKTYKSEWLCEKVIQPDLGVIELQPSSI